MLQYNTCFWALVKSGCTPQEAQATLKVRALHTQRNAGQRSAGQGPTACQAAEAWTTSAARCMQGEA